MRSAVLVGGAGVCVMLGWSWVGLLFRFEFVSFRFVSV